MRAATRFGFGFVVLAVGLALWGGCASTSNDHNRGFGTDGSTGTADGEGAEPEGGVFPEGSIVLDSSKPKPQLCDLADAPADCQVTAAAGCGDGILQTGEQCDDGN